MEFPKFWYAQPDGKGQSEGQQAESEKFGEPSWIWLNAKHATMQF